MIGLSPLELRRPFLLKRGDPFPSILGECRQRPRQRFECRAGCGSQTAVDGLLGELHRQRRVARDLTRQLSFLTV